MDIVNLLLKFGADIEAVDMAGRTPVVIAVKNQSINIMRILFIRGASPYVKSLSDKSMMNMSSNLIVRNLISIAEK